MLVDGRNFSRSRGPSPVGIIDKFLFVVFCARGPLGPDPGPAASLAWLSRNIGREKRRDTFRDEQPYTVTTSIFRNDAKQGGRGEPGCRSRSIVNDNAFRRAIRSASWARPCRTHHLSRLIPYLENRRFLEILIARRLILFKRGSRSQKFIFFEVSSLGIKARVSQ